MGQTHDTETRDAVEDPEVRQRSWVSAGITIAIAGVIAMVPALPEAIAIAPSLTFELTLSLFVGVALFTVTTTVAFHALGKEHRGYRMLSALDGTAQFGAIAYLVFATGSAASPLWAVSCLLAMRGTRPLKGSVSTGTVQLLLSHIPLSVAFLFLGRYVDALFSLSALFACLSVQTSTSKVAMEMLELQEEKQDLEEELSAELLSQERTRVARELHDGAAADITALVLQLRQRSVREADPALAKALEDKTLLVLREMRSVVVNLRNAEPVSFGGEPES